MSTQLLTAYELVGGYGAIDILHGVSLSVGVGEIVTVIGPNGAGKSTAFKTIVGFLRPKSGRVVFSGEEITGIRPDLVLRRGLAYVPQGRLVFPQMTVLENLEMGAYTVAEPARVAAALARVYELFPVLFELRPPSDASPRIGCAGGAGARTVASPTPAEACGGGRGILGSRRWSGEDGRRRSSSAARRCAALPRCLPTAFRARPAGDRGSPRRCRRRRDAS